MASLHSIDDSEWMEVKLINGYAVLMGNLMMAVRGLAFLVIAHTIVVLFGGFVSMLERDFWCLMVIALLQPAGIFSACIFKRAMDPFSGLMTQNNVRHVCNVRGAVELIQVLLGGAAALVEALASLIMCLGPGLELCVFGQFISTAISLCRLMQHDFHSKTNLNQSLAVLYALAVLQGVLFFYGGIMVFEGKRRVNQVAKVYGFHGRAVALVTDYLIDRTEEFDTGSNLVAYGVELVMTPSSYSSGTRILGTIIGPFRRQQPNNIIGQHMLIKQLIESAPCYNLLQQKWLQTLDLRSPYDSQLRECAARIVALTAEQIRLEDTPWVIKSISSLVETFEDWCQRDRCPQGRSLSSPDRFNTYQELLLQGMLILEKLVADQNNRSFLKLDNGAKVLRLKIISFVTSDLLHQINHDTWFDLVHSSLLVVGHFVGLGKGGMPGDLETMINTMERILKCDKCKDHEELQKEALGILILLVPTVSFVPWNNGTNILKILVDIFTSNRNNSFIRILAGKELERLARVARQSFMGPSIAQQSFMGPSIAARILQIKGDVVGSLTRILLDDKCKRYKQSAANILEHLCTLSRNNDKYVSKLKKTMTAVMPKLFGQILLPGLTKEGTEANQFRFGEPEAEENQCDKPQHDVRSKNFLSYHPQNGVEEDIQVALLSLCVTVCDKFIGADENLTSKLDAIAPGDSTFSFPRKLKEMAEKNKHPRPACLKILRLTCEMVISTMKHRGTYTKKDLRSLINLLSIASKDMFLLDGSMVFSSDAHGAETTKHYKTLASLVKEARQIVSKYQPQELVET